jgi:hypothetical protein
LALKNVADMFSKLDYSLFKTSVLPRILIALEKS